MLALQRCVNPSLILPRFLLSVLGAMWCEGDMEVIVGGNFPRSSRGLTWFLNSCVRWSFFQAYPEWGVVWASCEGRKTGAWGSVPLCFFFAYRCIDTQREMKVKDFVPKSIAVPSRTHPRGEKSLFFPLNLLISPPPPDNWKFFLLKLSLYEKNWLP